MGAPLQRTVLTVAAAVSVFGLAVAAGLKLTPEPRAQIDYLVIGSVATFLMLGVVFGLVLALWVKPRDFLAKRRQKTRPADSPQTR